MPGMFRVRYSFSRIIATVSLLLVAGNLVVGQVANMDMAGPDRLVALGDSLIVEQEYLLAKPYFEEALPLYDEQTYPRQTFHVLFWLGEIYYVEGRYRAALRVSQRADTIARQAGITAALEDYPQLLVNMGVFYSQLGELDSCRMYYEQSFAEAMQTYGRDSEQVADAYFSLGAVYKNMGQVRRSIHYTDTSARISRRIGYREGLSAAYSNLAYIYGELNDFSKAITYQEQAMRYAENRIDKALFLNNLGSLLIEVEDYQSAVGVLEESLAIRREIYPPGHYLPGSTLLNLASVYFGMDQWDKTLELTERFFSAYTLTEPGNAYNFQLAYLHRGSVFIRQGAYRKAMESARQVLAIDEPAGMPSGYLMLAKAQLQEGFLRQALANVQRGLQAQIPDFDWSSSNRYPPPALIESYPVLLDLLSTKTTILNQLYDREQKYALVQQTVRTAVYLDSLVSRARLYQKDYVSRGLLADDLGRFYAEAVRACYHLYQASGDRKSLEQAYYFSGKNKALQVSERLSVQSVDSLAAAAPKLIAQDRRLKSEIDFIANKLRYRSYFSPGQVREWDQQLLELQRRRENVLTELAEKSPEYFELVHRNSIATITDVQQHLLDPGEVLLEYVLTPSTTTCYLFVISRDKVGFLRHEWPDSPEKMILSFRNTIIRQEEGYVEAAQALYQTLLAPALPWLTDAEKIAVVPDGVLGLMPFELMVDPARSTPSDPHFVLETFQVRYLFSSRQGIESRRVSYTRRNGEVVVLAPAFEQGIVRPQNMLQKDSVFLPPLLGNQKELTTLRRRYAGRFFPGRQAKKGLLRTADGSSVLHISTHALIDDQFPAFSHLLLHDKNGGKHVPLYAYELLERRLNTELVVLSACNTGVGQIQEGQGVASLARAFAFAGSADLVVSLWPVRDDTTPVIMRHFYDNLESGLSKPEALRQAKLTFLNHTRGEAAHPYYWGTFIYTGDDQPVLLKVRSPLSLRRMWWLSLPVLLLVFWVIRRRQQG